MEEWLSAIKNSEWSEDYDFLFLYDILGNVIAVLVQTKETGRLIYTLDTARQIRTDYDEDIPLEALLKFDNLFKKYFPDFDTVAIYKDIKSRLMISINLMK